MRYFRLSLVFAGALAACGGTSPEGLFDQPAAGGSSGNSSSGGSSGSQGFAGSQSVGGSSGSAGPGGAAGAQGSGGSSAGGVAGTTGFGGSSAGAGSSGTGGVQGSSGTGGSAAVGGSDGGVIDPIDASAPDASQPCPAGSYAGNLSGPYQSRLGSSQFAARLEFTVGIDGATQGRYTATSNDTGRAELEGKLDCATGKLALDIVGSYGDILGTVRYTGTMTGTYRPETRSFLDGQWKITESNMSYGGQGTWSASLSVSAL